MLAANIKAAVEHSGRSQYDVSLGLGRSPNYLNRIVNGRKGITHAGLRELAAELGTSVGALVDPYWTDEASVSDIVASFVPVYPQVAAAGISGGTVTHFPTDARPFVFHRHRLEADGMVPEYCKVFLVEGDSMAPTLPDGCAVLVDGMQTRPVMNGLFVIQTGSELFVKRSKQCGPGWWWTCDNVQYPSTRWNRETTEIVGQVRWSMTRFG